MVNENVQGPIGLVGRGLTKKNNVHYVPGEFDTMDNLELTVNETIASRRGFNFVAQQTTAADFLPTNFRKFVGNYGPWPVWTTYNAASSIHGEMWISHALTAGSERSNSQVTDFDAMAADIFATEPALDSVDFQVEGFWHYNGANYYLVWCMGQWTTAGPTLNRKYYLAVFKETSAFDLSNADPLGTPPDFVVIASATAVGATNIAKHFDKFNLWPHMPVKNHLIFKERAWFATTDTVYASKALDPFIWAAPDGFFAKFPQQEIKQIYVLNDSLYIFLDTSIYVLQYDTDPNTDATITLISKEVGAEAVTAVGDTIYFIKDSSLYTLNGFNVSKVIDLQLNIFPQANTSTQGYSLAMSSFDNEIFFFPRYINKAGTWSDWKGSKAYFKSTTDTPIYRFSLNTNSFNTITVGDSLKRGWNTLIKPQTPPIDVCLVTTESWSNQTALYVAFDSIFEGTPGQVFGFFDIDNVFCDRVLADTLFQFKFVVPKFKLDLFNFTPDGLPYYMKKYRTLLLSVEAQHFEDVLTTDDVYPTLTPRYGQTVAGAQSVQDRIPTSDSIKGYRYPLNQRAKTIGITLQREPILRNAYENARTFELNDMRVLWSYTGRAPHNNINDNS